MERVVANDAPPRVGRVSVTCGLIAIAIGALSLLGWIESVDALTRVGSGLPAMSAISAIGLISAGLALLLLANHHPRPYQLLGRGLALATAFLGVTVVLEYIFGDLGVVEMLTIDADGESGSSRPSPHSAAGLIVAGLALAAVDRDVPRFRPEQILTGGLWLAVITASLGFVYEVEYLRGVGEVGGMAINTIAGLIAVAVGISFLRPDRGAVSYVRRDDPGAAVVRTMLPVVVLLPLALGLARFEAQELGLFGREIGFSIETLGSMAVLLGVVWISASRLSASDAKRAEAERDRRKLEAVTTRLPMAFYQAQPGEDGRWRYVTPQIETMLGYSCEQWIDDPGLWARVLHPEDRERTIRHEIATWGSQVPETTGAFECRMIKNTGETIWVRDEAVLGDDGYLDGILTDITGRRSAEERFRRLLEAAPDPMVIVDEQGVIRLVNHEVENVLGYTRDELVGESVEVLVPERLRDQHAGKRLGYVHNPKTRPMGSGIELHVRRKDGSELPVEISLSPMESDEGTLVIAAIRDVTKQREAERALRHMAEHDPLTGLHNRRRFEEEFQRVVAAAGRYETPGAVLVLDIDQFKGVNDTLGHAAGDQLLVEIAALLRKRLRETDVVGRLGGDEFAVVLTHVGLDEVRTVATSLLAIVRSDARLPSMPDAEVSVSVGCALIDPENIGSAERLLSHADIALYKAKRTGRDRFCVYGEDELELELTPSQPAAVAPVGGSPPSA